MEITRVLNPCFLEDIDHVFIHVSLKILVPYSRFSKNDKWVLRIRRPHLFQIIQNVRRFNIFGAFKPIIKHISTNIIQKVATIA